MKYKLIWRSSLTKAAAKTMTKSPEQQTTLLDVAHILEHEAYKLREMFQHDVDVEWIEDDYLILTTTSRRTAKLYDFKPDHHPHDHGGES